MHIRTYLSCAALLAIQGVLIMPANAQSTTLTGSVLRRAPASEPPVLKARTPKLGTTQVRTVPRNTAPRSRTVTKTVTRTIIVDKRDKRTYFQRHPKVKSALVGAGVGAGTGAVAGLISRRGVLRGTAVGAGTGAGVGLIRSSHTMRRHPIVKNVATGTVAGLGLGVASSRRGSTIGKSTAVGAAIGLGYSLFKKLR